jgi:hypothetical protein
VVVVAVVVASVVVALVVGLAVVVGAFVARVTPGSARRGIFLTGSNGCWLRK